MSEVALLLTEREVALLDYVLRRAQEDPEFFGAAGGADTQVSTVFSMSLGRLLAKVRAAGGAQR